MSDPRLGVREALLACRDRFPASREAALRLLALLSEGRDVTSRSLAEGHVTASACLLPPTGGEALMIRSTKFGGWLLPGGHVDPGEAPWQAALRELREETGLGPDAVEAGVPGLGGYDHHPIPANAKRGEPAHRHFDLQYVVRARMRDLPLAGFDRTEAAEAAWRPLADLLPRYRVLHAALTGGSRE